MNSVRTELMALASSMNSTNVQLVVRCAGRDASFQNRASTARPDWLREIAFSRVTFQVTSCRRKRQKPASDRKYQAAMKSCQVLGLAPVTG